MSIKKMGENYTQLVEDCRHRDRKAMRRLYELTAPMAMGVCMRYCRNRETAQDVMQEGYIKVYENLKSVKEPEKVMSWVYHIMVNECINHCHRQKPTEYLEDNQMIEPVVFPTDPFGDEEVVLALQQVPPRQRAVFNMLEVEGLTEEEVAERMATPVTNVRILLTRAKNCLKEILTK